MREQDRGGLHAVPDLDLDQVPDTVIVRTEGIAKIHEWLGRPGDDRIYLQPMRLELNPDSMLSGELEKRGQVESLTSSVRPLPKHQTLPRVQEIFPGIAKELPYSPNAWPTGKR